MTYRSFKQKGKLQIKMAKELQAPNPYEFVTVQQAAKFLKVTPQTIRNFIRDGLIEAVSLRPGAKRSRWRIRYKELDRLLVRVKPDSERQSEDKILEQLPENASNPAQTGVNII